jgi:hypothetical protein
MKRITMKHAFPLVAAACAGVLFPAAAGALSYSKLWSKFGGDASNQQTYATAIDEETGRVAITGPYSGSIDLGGGALTSAGGSDAFLALYEADGTFVAAKSFGDAGGNQYGYGVGFDGDGNVFLAGYFSSIINLGGSNLVSAGGADIFLARFDSFLNHVVSKRFGDLSNQYPLDLVVDGTGDVLITGYFQGGVDFGGGLLTSAGGDDAYIARFNSSLTHEWSARFGDAATQRCQGIAVDADGEFYVTGFFSGTINLGAGNLTSLGGNDIFMAKFSAAGAHQWSARFGDANNNLGQKIAVTPAGDVFLLGHFTGAVNFGGAVLTSSGAEDIFLARFNTSGAHQWSKRFGDASSQFGYGIDVDASGVYFGGAMLGSANFGLGNLTSAGGRDAYVVKLDLDGNYQFARLFGDATDQYGLSVDAGAGRVALGGYFNGTMALASGNATSAGALDAFVEVFGSFGLEPVIKSITDIGNDQGRRVRVRFSRSGYDDAVSPDPVLAYDAFVCGEDIPSGALSAAGGCEYVYVGSIPAGVSDTYTMIVPTFADSTIANGDFDTGIYIVAAKSAPNGHHFSTPAWGSSIDNLAPAAPRNLTFDQADLAWFPSEDEDFNYFAVWGSPTPDPEDRTIIGYTVDPVLDVSASPAAYYFVTAVDFAGNEGAPGMLRVLSGIGDDPAAHVLSLAAAPNPFNPSTTLRYTVPARGRVRIDVFDARGARVASLVDAERAAGAYAVAWNGLDERGGRAGSGVYFARIATGAETRTCKLVLLK